jgi:hypothetical protein
MLLRIYANSKKKLYKFIPIFDLTDLEYNYPEIKDDEEEITKVLLRNLTGINKLYNYLNKISKIEVLNEETGNKKMIIRDDILKRVDTNRKKDSRTTLRSNSNRMATSKKNTKKAGNTFLQLNTNLVPKIEEEIRSDDIFFCIQLKDFWHYARENGLFNNKITISEFNRIFNQGKINNFETFQIPKALTDSHDIYNYIDNMINQSKENFAYKYETYINYYYKDGEIPNSLKINRDNIPKKNYKNRIINSIHNNKRIILPRLFYECLIRLAFLTYHKSNDIEERNMKLSKKLEKLLDLIIPAKMKKKGNSIRTSISKLEQSFNNSANIIEGNKAKISEFKTIEEFLTLFNKELKYLFNKIYTLSHTSMNFFHSADNTIQHLFFYKKVICTSPFLRQQVPDILAYIELISYFYKLKLNFTENLKKMQKNEFFDIINNMLMKEMNEYEFDEIIFLMCKNFIANNKKKLTFNEITNYLNILKDVFDKLKMSKQLKKKYYYPKLKSHQVKEQLIIEEKKRIEEEK